MRKSQSGRCESCDPPAHTGFFFRGCNFDVRPPRPPLFLREEPWNPQNQREMSAYRLASQRLRGSSVSAASSSSNLPVVVCTLIGMIGGGAVANSLASPYARRPLNRLSAEPSSNGVEIEPTMLSEHIADFRKTYVLSTYVSTRTQMDQLRRRYLDGDSSGRAEPPNDK